MARCVAESCREIFADDWSFCPSCGQDNRPPEKQVRFREKYHTYQEGLPYCTRCGLGTRSQRALHNRWPLALYLLSIALAAGALFALFNSRPVAGAFAAAAFVCAVASRVVDYCVFGEDRFTERFGTGSFLSNLFSRRRPWR